MTPDSPRPAWLEIEGVANARDVGGLPTVDGRTTRPRVLLRSANLQRLTPAGADALVDELGVRTVLDLRTDAERRLEGPTLLEGRVQHVTANLVPHEEGDGDEDDVERAVPVRRERWAEPGDMTGVYVGYVEDLPQNLADALRTLADPASGTVLVHCAAGKDRTGTVVALALSLAGVPRDVVVADYVASAERIDDVLAALQGSATYGDELSDVTTDLITPRAGSMERFLDHVDQQYGGPHGLATAIGVDEETVARLVARLVGSSDLTRPPA